MQLLDAEVVRGGEEVVDPVPARVHFQPVAGVGSDKGAPAAVFLHPEVELGGAAEHAEELLVLAREAEMVDARLRPLARLDHNIDRAALKLAQPEPKAELVELLPGDSWFVRSFLVSHASVTSNELEAELSEIAGFEVTDPAGEQVVVEQLHRCRV